METKTLMRWELDSLRHQYNDAANILALMEKTTKPEKLAAMKEEKLAPLKSRIEDIEGFLNELDAEDWWKT
jgi:hypothetical protein